MRGSANGVDDGLTMTSTLLSHEQLEHLFPTATGRFGRQIKTIAWADPETAPTRTTTVWRMRERMKSSDFQIDPRVVSGAIVERMYAGHAL
jgi:hypothetical protein